MGILIAGLAWIAFVAVMGYRSLVDGVADRYGVKLLRDTSKSGHTPEVTTWVEELTAQGFEPIDNLRAELGVEDTTATARMVVLVSPDGMTAALPSQIHHVARVEGGDAIGTTMTFLDFSTELSDGRSVTTSNASLNLFDPNPKHPNLRRPLIRKSQELLEAHKKHLAKRFGTATAKPVQRENFAEYMERCTRESYDFQISRGLLARQGDLLMRTPKIALRGVARFLLPVLEPGGMLTLVKLVAVSYGAFVIGSAMKIAEQTSWFTMLGLGATVGGVSAYVFHPTTLVATTIAGTAAAFGAGGSQIALGIALLITHGVVSDFVKKRELARAEAGMKP